MQLELQGAFSFHRARPALDLNADEIPPTGGRWHFWRGRPVVVWLPLDGLAFSISADQRYGSSPTASQGPSVSVGGRSASWERTAGRPTADFEITLGCQCQSRLREGD
jgi:hypothetical protein